MLRANILELPREYGPSGGEEYIIPPDIDEIVLIHGTTAKFLEQILEDGVTPRKLNRNNAWGYLGGKFASQHNLSYWGDFHTAKRAALNAIRRWRPPRMYVQAVIPVDRLHPDEDMHTDSWRESLSRGACGCDIEHIRNIVNILVTGPQGRPIENKTIKFI